MKKHILLVEDNERLRSNLLFVLNKEGFDAVGAVNGAEALQVIAKDIPDLVISDIMMPDMDGYDLVKHLRESASTLSVPIIFLTAKGNPEELRSGMLHGVDDYLTKPVNINDLLATINVRLERADEQKKKWIANLNNLQLHLATILPHEVRTPVSGILGASSFLQSEGESLSREDVEELNNTITVSVSRLVRVTENFLLYSQLHILFEEQQLAEQQGSDSDGMNRISNARGYIEEVVDLCALRNNRPHDVRCQLHDGAIRCNGAHFGKALYEIIDNAFQFSPSGSPVEITSCQQGEIYTVSVTDYGRGMSSEQVQLVQELPTIFKQFDRQRFEQQGMGLGLVLVYSIAQLYGGKVTVSSVQGQSTTVSLQFHVLPEYNLVHS
jgi:two-component system, sensor histidine kinase and response regulator